MPYDDPMNPGGGDNTGGASTGTSSPTTPGQTGRDAFLAWARPVLSRVYKMYLGRDISDGEFASYTGPNASQGTVQQAADAVMGSSESKAYQTANPGLWGREPGSGATNTTTTTTTNEDTGGGGGGGGGNGGGGGGNTTATPPPPVFTPPPYTPPPAFSYADFVAPDPNDLDKDPAHAYTLKTQQNAIQHSAAARGVLNTGGTVNDLLLNARDINSTDYSNLYNRKMSTYAANRGNALDTYNTNYGTQVKDPYQISYMGAQDAYNATQHNFDLGTQYNWYRTLFDFQKDQDAWQRRYQLLNFA